jgi:hypothetical protein
VKGLKVDPTQFSEENKQAGFFTQVKCLKIDPSQFSEENKQAGFFTQVKGLKVDPSQFSLSQWPQVRISNLDGYIFRLFSYTEF